ncbi:MAG TPA: IPExxxVDY family protein [Bacteroidales bacterium]|nr:IPExxxVDY family protein [Bacteroidales bacterium]
MARKKQILKSIIDSDVCIIGITCHLKSYRLSFSMNKALKFHFRRIDDFPSPDHSGNEMLFFPFMTYDDPDLKNLFCLVGNHHPQGKLMPNLRQVDYFLMAKNPLEKSTRSGLMDKIRKISQVVAAYEIDPARTRDLDTLMEELELHLLVSGRKRNAARA